MGEMRSASGSASGLNHHLLSSGECIQIYDKEGSQ